MASQRFDQCTFTQGELDPRVQKRIDWQNYYKAAKQIRNALVIPQGGVQHRFGTTYVDTLTVVANDLSKYAELANLIYNNEAIYVMTWEALTLKIYLENLLVATVATQYLQEDIPTLRLETQIQTRLMITTGNYKPQQLVRSTDAPVAITANTATTLTANTGYAAGLVLPVLFAGGALPVTQPQIFAGRNYFIRTFAANTFSI